MTVFVSDSFALRYALLVIGVIQLLSISISSGITSSLDKLENNN